jgi:hypothetical protein
MPAITRRKSNPAKMVAVKSTADGGRFPTTNVRIPIRRRELRKLPATERDKQPPGETAFDACRSVGF